MVKCLKLQYVLFVYFCIVYVCLLLSWALSLPTERSGLMRSGSCDSGDGSSGSYVIRSTYSGDWRYLANSVKSVTL